MNRKSAFLAKAPSSNSLIGESKILMSLESKNKGLIISVEKLEFLSNHFAKLMDEIDKLHRAYLYVIVLKEDGSCEVEKIGSRDIRQADIINLTNERFREDTGHCFIVNNGMRFHFFQGKIDPSIDSCFEYTKAMQEKLEILHPVSALPKVFEYFLVDCKNDTIYKTECFTANGKVKGTIKEQELRNILLHYLKKNMKGDVQTEFCTDYTNDEESVDIYVNDGNQRAIIEVKFSILGKYYEGKTVYNLFRRVGDGLSQLNKYALHLAKDGRQVEFGYVYMFYINEMDFSELKANLETVIATSRKSLSTEFNSIFSGVITNDMSIWGSVAS